MPTAHSPEHTAVSSGMVSNVVRNIRETAHTHARTHAHRHRETESKAGRGGRRITDLVALVAADHLMWESTA